MELYVRFDHPIDDADLEPLRIALKKRGEGIPIQHLLGTVFFRNHEFKTDARGLIPRPETEELAEWLAKNVKLADGARILDMGCGSGVLGLSLAADFPKAEVTLADISPDALALAQENAEFTGLKAKFIESDLFSALPVEPPFDLIAANLPYVPDAEDLAPEVRHDPALALFGGADGMDVIRRFIPEAAKRLAAGGWVAMEIGHDQSIETEALLRDASFTDVLTLKDLSGIPRFPIAKRGSV